ncbi:MAG: Hsp33 family molecular chaperone HslO, partial [Thiohalobacteraceae bacterium]
AALLVTTIKFNGSLIMQVQGDGPVSLVVVQAKADRTLRGLAHWTDPVLPGPLAQLVGKARLAITIDQGGDRERYQGIVALESEEHFAGALEDYFARSEQLATRLWLSAGPERAAGLLLQALPGETDDADAWNRTVQLADTLRGAELLELPHRELLRRLFHEEDVRLFEPEPVSFRCSCTRERIETVLRSLGYAEVKGIIEEQGQVSVDCEFCNQNYLFDPVDVEKLFAAADHQPAVPPTRH